MKKNLFVTMVVIIVSLFSIPPVLAQDTLTVPSRSIFFSLGAGFGDMAYVDQENESAYSFMSGNLGLMITPNERPYINFGLSVLEYGSIVLQPALSVGIVPFRFMPLGAEVEMDFPVGWDAKGKIFLWDPEVKVALRLDSNIYYCKDNFYQGYVRLYYGLGLANDNDQYFHRKISGISMGFNF